MNKLFTAFSFLKSLPLKLWLYLALLLLYPLLYSIGHHKGYVSGSADTEYKYEKASRKAQAEEKKKEDKDRANALKENQQLRHDLAQNEASKNELQKRLNNALAKKPIVGTCPSVDPDNLRVLQDSINKASQ